MNDDAGDPERTTLLAILTSCAAAGIVALLVVRGHLLVPVWAAVATVVPWAGFAIWLRIERRGLGREGRYLDWWSIPHAIAGVLFAFAGIEGWIVAAIATGWELLEIGCRVREHPANRVIDVVLALAGWGVTAAVLGVPIA